MARQAALGVHLTNLLFPRSRRSDWYKGLMLVLTFLAYASYHLSRKPIGVVKGALHQNCTEIYGPSDEEDPCWCCWEPFDSEDYERLLGALDYAFLFAYAIGLFASGHIGERMNLRYFLSIGMILSGLFTACMGLAFFLQIHSCAYFLTMQIIGGVVQGSGWPSVVAVIANWFGKGRRGLIMGIWYSNVSVGGIVGAVIAGIFVKDAWGWSFVVPGCILSSMGVIVFLFLFVYPSEVDCEQPVQNKEVDRSQETPTDLIDQPAISFLSALAIPGVIEFSLCLFFLKLVSYSFLYWLPFYLLHNVDDVNVTQAAYLSTVFDIGGIFGAIMVGHLADITDSSAIVSFIFALLCAPLIFIYHFFGTASYTVNMALMSLTGFCVNGPNALIVTAVSADLGTHPSLHGNAKALSTVTAIIDGTGTVGAAVGPLLTGLIAPSSDLTWTYVFLMLSGAELMGALLMTRQVVTEVNLWKKRRRKRVYGPVSLSETDCPNSTRTSTF